MTAGPRDRAAGTPLASLRTLRFAYADSPPLFDDFTTDFAPGVTLLFGDSGSGKSTLLSILAGCAPTHARIEAQRIVAGIEFDRDPQAYRQAVFWCEPDTRAFDDLAVAQYGASQAAERPFFDALAWRAHVMGFGLEPHLHKPIYQLSTGSRRKLWWATAFASGCPLILLDEPTAALDAPSIAYLKDCLRGLASKADRAVVVASFSPLDDVVLAATISLPLPSPG